MPVDPTDQAVLVNEDGTEIDPDAFVDWVRDHPANILGLELSHALAECISATQMHGKRSTIKLDIGIELGDSYFGELLVTPRVTVKPAEADPQARPFFPTDRGGLSRSNPSQSQLPGIES
jgi:hypothetical protein